MSDAEKPESQAVGSKAAKEEHVITIPSVPGQLVGTISGAPRSWSVEMELMLSYLKDDAVEAIFEEAFSAINTREGSKGKTLVMYTTACDSLENLLQEMSQRISRAKKKWQLRQHILSDLQENGVSEECLLQSVILQVNLNSEKFGIPDRGWAMAESERLWRLTFRGQITVVLEWNNGSRHLLRFPIKRFPYTRNYRSAGQHITNVAQTAGTRLGSS